MQNEKNTISYLSELIECPRTEGKKRFVYFNNNKNMNYAQRLRAHIFSCCLVANLCFFNPLRLMFMGVRRSSKQKNAKKASAQPSVDCPVYISSSHRCRYSLYLLFGVLQCDLRFFFNFFFDSSSITIIYARLSYTFAFFCRFCWLI